MQVRAVAVRQAQRTTTKGGSRGLFSFHIIRGWSNLGEEVALASIITVVNAQLVPSPICRNRRLKQTFRCHKRKAA